MFEKYSVSAELIKYFICVFLKKCQQIKIAIFSLRVTFDIYAILTDQGEVTSNPFGVNRLKDP